jgi:hypothetical protein
MLIAYVGEKSSTTMIKKSLPQIAPTTLLARAPGRQADMGLPEAAVRNGAGQKEIPAAPALAVI